MIVYIKSREELEGFKLASKHAAEILEKLIKAAKPGVELRHLDELANKECKSRNIIPIFLNYNGFPGSVCLSVNEELVHGIPSDRTLKEGDVLTIDFGSNYNGYIGDTAETIVVGQKQNNLIKCCKKALMEAIKLSVPGNKLNDIGRVISGIAKKNGYCIPYGYGGHGINRYELHGSPFVPNYEVIEKENITLRKGMIIAIEPMFIDGTDNTTSVKDDNWTVVASGISAHCEHTIMVDKNPLILTKRGMDVKMCS